ncbi:MAG: DUF2075 domain-containing protein [Phycisphaerae bacterium]|nr:DUF2075 domain-containing protein [Phycisphaerae bacterium]
MTQPALERVCSIVHQAARTKSRRLILLSGVPGSGKTLVGLQLVHAHFLDDLAVARNVGKPTAPAVFLSGNAPLVEVLQYELAGAGGDGKAFVRGVKDYLRTYASKKHAIPPQHVLVFDEAQRAWDADYVAEKHGGLMQSEPELFIELAERAPDWCVVLGLVGSGQEIHMGEEGGLRQWTEAISRSPRRDEWVVHASATVLSGLGDAEVAQQCAEELTLTAELRFHLTRDVHAFVAALVEYGDHARCADLARTLEENGYSLRMVRELEVGQQYLRDRFSNDPEARFGIVASSRDRDLKRFRVYNDFQSTKRIRVGRWFGASETTGGRDSCCSFEQCVTEFQCQGLELDAALVAWGTDLRRVDGEWSIEGASKYMRKGRASVKDPHRLRVNAYRVLLTRGRNATVIFVPQLAELDETAAFIELAGFKPLS